MIERSSGRRAPTGSECRVNRVLVSGNLMVGSSRRGGCDLAASLRHETPSEMFNDVVQRHGAIVLRPVRIDSTV